MKAKLHISMLFCVTCITSSLLAQQDDIKVRTVGFGADKCTNLSTNVTSLTGRLNWDGTDGGGQYEVTARLADGNIVLVEETKSFSKGITSEVSGRTIIPTNRLPYTTAMSQTTVSVYRATQPVPTDNATKFGK